MEGRGGGRERGREREREKQPHLFPLLIIRKEVWQRPIPVDGSLTKALAARVNLYQLPVNTACIIATYRK